MSGRVMTKTAGFTLAEMMIAILLLAVLAAIGVPSYQNLILRNRLSSQTNALVASINLARSEAVQRGKQVILCRTANPNSATPSCGGTAKTWTTGWLVFVNDDLNATFDSGTDQVLRRDSAASNNITIMANTDADAALVYNPDGTKTGTGTATFAVCAGGDTATGRQVSVSTVGRPQLTKGSIASCTP